LTSIFRAQPQQSTISKDQQDEEVKKRVQETIANCGCAELLSEIKYLSYQQQEQFICCLISGIIQSVSSNLLLNAPLTPESRNQSPSPIQVTNIQSPKVTSLHSFSHKPFIPIMNLLAQSAIQHRELEEEICSLVCGIFVDLSHCAIYECEKERISNDNNNNNNNNREQDDEQDEDWNIVSGWEIFDNISHYRTNSYQQGSDQINNNQSKNENICEFCKLFDSVSFRSSEVIEFLSKQVQVKIEKHFQSKKQIPPVFPALRSLIQSNKQKRWGICICDSGGYQKLYRSRRQVAMTAASLTLSMMASFCIAPSDHLRTVAQKTVRNQALELCNQAVQFEIQRQKDRESKKVDNNNDSNDNSINDNSINRSSNQIQVINEDEDEDGFGKDMAMLFIDSILPLMFNVIASKRFFDRKSMLHVEQINEQLCVDLISFSRILLNILPIVRNKDDFNALVISTVSLLSTTCSGDKVGKYFPKGLIEQTFESIKIIILIIFQHNLASQVYVRFYADLEPVLHTFLEIVLPTLWNDTISDS
ncbi:MAG: hypothetical protein EZS28_028228, partial [Streblomastix strix]